MGWLKSVSTGFSRLRHGYNNFKHGFKRGFNKTTNIPRYIGQGMHKVDDFMVAHSNIPVVGQVLTQIKADPLWASALGAIDGIVADVDTVRKVGDLIAKGFDRNKI